MGFAVAFMTGVSFLKINVKAASATTRQRWRYLTGTYKFGKNITDIMHMKAPVHSDAGARYGSSGGMSVLPR